MTAILLVQARSDDLEHAMASGASVIVADLTCEQGTVVQRRELTSAWLRGARRSHGGPALLVQVHGLTSGSTDHDLDAIFPNAPDGIMLPACRSGEDVQHLGAKLAVREADYAFGEHRIRILAVGASSASALLAMGTYAGASPRLMGLTWDSGALLEDLGLPPPGPNHEEPSPLGHARVLTVLAAKSASVPAFDASCCREGDDLDKACARARRDGFSGKLSRDHRQSPIIEQAFGPLSGAGFSRIAP